MTRPNPRTVAWTTTYVVASAVDAVLAASPARRRLRWFTKPVLMPVLNAALRSVEDADPAARRGLGAAQALSWAGDVALLGPGERAFLTGLGSFFGAHLAYVATFLTHRDPAARMSSPGVRAALALWLATAPPMTVAARRRDPALAGPVAAYATLLAVMFAAGSTLDPQRPARARQTVIAGTGLFLVSDTMLGVQRFLLADERPTLEVAVMATYAAAQGLIAAGVAQL